MRQILWSPSFLCCLSKVIYHSDLFEECKCTLRYIFSEAPNVLPHRCRLLPHLEYSYPPHCHKRKGTSRKSSHDAVQTQGRAPIDIYLVRQTSTSSLCRPAPSSGLASSERKYYHSEVLAKSTFDQDSLQERLKVLISHESNLRTTEHFGGNMFEEYFWLRGTSTCKWLSNRLRLQIHSLETHIQNASILNVGDFQLTNAWHQGVGQKSRGEMT